MMTTDHEEMELVETPTAEKVEEPKVETKVEPKVEPKKIEPPKPIELNETGAMVPKDAGQLYRTIEQIAAGGGFPKRFDTPAKRMAAYNLGNALMGSKWQLAINNISDIKGTLSIFGELPGALAEMTGQVKEKEVYCIDEQGEKICVKNKNLNAKPYAGVCNIQKKGRVMKEFTYTLEDATQAEQYPPMKHEWVNNKKTGNKIPDTDSPWLKFTKIMLMRKAMNLAVKMEFPDAIVGVPIAEYDFDAAPDLMKDVGPYAPNKGDRAKDLNSRFNGSNFSSEPSADEPN